MYEVGFKGATPGALDTCSQGSGRHRTGPPPKTCALACVRASLPAVDVAVCGGMSPNSAIHMAPQKFCFQFFLPAALQSLFGRLLVHYRRLKSGIDSSHPVGGTLHISESVFQRRICPLELILGSWHILCYEKIRDGIGLKKKRHELCPPSTMQTIG